MSLRSLKGKYDGERIFLIGNGPSLDRTPLDRLQGEYSFAMNKITNIYDSTSWRPSFYYFGHSDMNPEKRRYVQFHVDADVTCFLNSVHSDRFGERNDVYYFDRSYMKYESPFEDESFHGLTVEEARQLPIEKLEECWSDDVCELVYTYHSMYGVMQLASYMGFDEMYLLGCDLGDTYHSPHIIFPSGLDPLSFDAGDYRFGPNLSFLLASVRSGRPIRSLANGLLFKALMSRYYWAVGGLMHKLNLFDDSHHFGSSYMYKPRDMSVLSAEITKSHVVANRLSERKGFRVYNATLGGDLEVYPRVDLHDIL